MGDTVIANPVTNSDDTKLEEGNQPEDPPKEPATQEETVLENPSTNADDTHLQEENQPEDPPEEPATQEETVLENPSTNADDTDLQEENQPEYPPKEPATQQDTVLVNPAVNVDDTQLQEENQPEDPPKESATQEDNVPENPSTNADDTQLQEENQPEDPPKEPTKQEDNVPENPSTNADDTQLQEENQPIDSPEEPASQEDNVPDNPEINVDGTQLQEENQLINSPEEPASEEGTSLKNPVIKVDEVHLTEDPIQSEEPPKEPIIQDGVNQLNVQFRPGRTSQASLISQKSPGTKKKVKIKRKRNTVALAIELTPTQKFVQEHIKMKLLGGEHVPTTCYGNIEFKETTKRATGRFVRCANDTKPENLFKLLTEHWKLNKPRLLISVTGGAMSFDLKPQLKKDFKDGLLKVASTPGSWVISGGTNTGVMKLVGDAIHGTECVCIGIMTWGIVAKRDTLIPTDDPSSDVKATKFLGLEERISGETFPYRLGSYLVQKGEAFLDYNHTHFIMVDDGTVGKWGREIKLRGEFEEYLMQQANRIKIPSVLLVLEGGPGTLNTVYEAVKNSIPCVIIEGSGRAADVLVYAINSAEEILELEEQEKQHEGLINEIMCVFNLSDTKKVMDFKSTVIECIKKKEVFTLANMRTGMDTDDAILTALLKDRKSAPSHYEQMRLAILWDRVDLAQTRIMSKVTSWTPRKDGPGEAQRELNKLMIMALALGKVEFVRLLLDYGVSIKSLLTRQILEFLYAFSLRNEDHSTMRYELRTHPMTDPSEEYKHLFESLLQYNSPHCSTGRKGTGIKEINLEDVRDKIYDLLQTIPSKCLEKVVEIPGESITPGAEREKFTTPFRQLFIWAVLNNMLDMALMLWEFEDDAICKALTAAEITNGLIRNIRNRDLQDEVVKSLELSFDTYEKLSLDLLDLCYKTAEKNTELLITMRLDVLSDYSSSLDLAVASEQRDFVSHSCVQGILNDVWTGSIIQRHTNPIRLICCIFLPFMLKWLEIRTRKEMKQMIQASHVDCEDEEEGEEEEEDQQRIKSKPAEEMETEEDTKRRERNELPLHRKFYYFHVYSPVVRFYVHTFGYLLFLMLFAYIATSKKATSIPAGLREASTVLTGVEILLIITVIGYATGEIYELFHIDAPSFALKIADYAGDFWNQVDILCLLVFLIAVILRSIESTIEFGHLFYAFDVSLWIIRLINILYVSPVAGPYVVMIGHMFVDLMNFIILLVIFLLAYGIGMKGILNPGPDDVDLFVDSIFRPYFNWHGQYFFNQPSDNVTSWWGTPKVNSYTDPIAFIYLGLYLLIVNILLLNLVIAIFNSTYEKIMAIATRVWKFQRYGLIVEYAQRRSFLFPPFSLIFHLYIFIRWLLSLCTKVQKKSCSSGLKQHINLDDAKKSQLRELESNCLIKLVRKRKQIQAANADHDSSDSSLPVQHGDADMKFDGQQMKMLEKLEDVESKLDLVQTGLQQKKGKEEGDAEAKHRQEQQDRITVIEQFLARDEEAKKEKQSLEGSLLSKEDELDKLKRRCERNEIDEENFRNETKRLNEELQRLQIDNKIYLQEIVKKKNELKDQQRRIEELEEKAREQYSTSGIEN